MIRVPTVEWQVAGACNYDCSYCIQSPRHRRGRPDRDAVSAALDALAALPGTWEVKCSGGEAFAHPLFMEVVVPGLMHRTPHRISILTNFSADRDTLVRFVELTRGRLSVFSASLHLEHVELDAFATKAAWFVGMLDDSVRFVVNQVVRPGHEHEAAACRDRLAVDGVRWFPQLYKVKQKGGADPMTVAEYPDREALRAVISEAPGPREANIAPSYQGRRCWTGVDYFIVDKNGEAWSCRTAKRHKTGRLGNVYEGSLVLREEPTRCPWSLCPCTVPANRGMIEGPPRPGSAP